MEEDDDEAEDAMEECEKRAARLIRDGHSPSAAWDAVSGERIFQCAKRLTGQRVSS